LREFPSSSVKYNEPSNPYSLIRGEWESYRGRSGLVITLYSCMLEVPSAKLGWDTACPDRLFLWLSSVPPQNCQDSTRL